MLTEVVRRCKKGWSKKKLTVLKSWKPKPPLQRFVQAFQHFLASTSTWGAKVIIPFSSTSDFGLIKKTVGLYLKVCSICDIYPEEVIHVGDDHFFDFNVPKKLGIMAFYLDRTGEQSGESVIHTLKELSLRFVERTLQKGYKRS